jgi:hypothetical protein
MFKYGQLLNYVGREGIIFVRAITKVRDKKGFS